VGFLVGGLVGSLVVGRRVGGAVGSSDGTRVGDLVGFSVGVCDGANDGLSVVGGSVVGTSVGLSVGVRVGSSVGESVGVSVGSLVLFGGALGGLVDDDGWGVTGAFVGLGVGAGVFGASVGLAVGAAVQVTSQHDLLWSSGLWHAAPPHCGACLMNDLRVCDPRFKSDPHVQPAHTPHAPHSSTQSRFLHGGTFLHGSSSRLLLGQDSPHLFGCLVMTAFLDLLPLTQLPHSPHFQSQLTAFILGGHVAVSSPVGQAAPPHSACFLT
jgi:hypothetical protein